MSVAMFFIGADIVLAAFFFVLLKCVLNKEDVLEQLKKERKNDFKKD